MGNHEGLAELAFRDAESAVAILREQYDVRIGDVLVALNAVPHELIPVDTLDTRSVNTLFRRRCKTWGDLAALTVGDLWQTNNVGQLTVSRILSAAAEKNLDVAESVPIDPNDPQVNVSAPVTAEAFTLAAVRELARFPDLLSLEHALADLGVWAMRERGARELRDLILCSPDLGKVPADLQERLETLLSLPLLRYFDTSSVDLDRGLAEDFIDGIGDRRDLFIARHIRLGARPTLAELGEAAGVSRERVRQLEEKASGAVESLRCEPRFAPLIWRASDLGDSLGSATPFDTALVEDALRRATEGLRDPLECSARELILWLAGPYKLDSGWLLRADVSRSSIDDAFQKRVGDAWLVNGADAQSTLADLGVRGLDMDELCEIVRGWRDIGDGWLVRWSGAVTDKAEVVFRLTCKPWNVEDLNDMIGEGHAYASVRNALTADDRFVRLDKAGKFGLREWGLEEYSGIAQEITERIERGGGTAVLNDVVAELADQFGVSENSVRMYAATPAFVLEDGIIRLRTDADSYKLDRRINRVRGLYVDRKGRVILTLPVDGDTMRGSGRSIPEAAGVLLGLRPGMRKGFTHPRSGATVVVSWRATSTMGPTIGSLRALAQDLDLHLGDQMRVRLDPTSETCKAEPVDPATLRGLTGLKMQADTALDVLAEAIGTDPGSVRAQLQARGDDQVLRLLPAVATSPDLEDALSQFGALLGIADSAT